MSNPIVLNTSSRIGKISAEADDEFLFECFVDNSALAELKDLNSPKMLLLGSTGAGKTAIIRKIRREFDRTNLVQLDEMALDYLANSDVIQFLLSIDVSLDLFFQALWKHVVLIEFIRVKFDVCDENKSRFVFEQIFNAFRKDQRKQRGIEYLRKWESKFWISMDENIREITENLEQGVKTELASELSKFNANAGYSRTLSTEKRSQLQRVARKFVAPELLTDLAKVVDTLADHSTRVEPCYILIDRLDENWIDPSIKYPLIRALIESLKSLRRISDLKIVVALRSDLLEKVILETRDAGFQSEKYEDYIVRIRWTSGELKRLINRRINFLYRRKYNKENITFENIFTEKVTNTGKPFNVMIEKSLLRPRDLINFVNMCLETSEGSYTITRKTFTQAERNYSANRLTAMIEEWQNVVKRPDILLDTLRGRREAFGLGELCTTDLLNNLVVSFPDTKSSRLDDFWQLVEDATTRHIEPIEFGRILVEKLYLMGAIGVKLDSSTPFQYFFETQKPLPSNHLAEDTRIRVHSMLHSALGVVR